MRGYELSLSEQAAQFVAQAPTRTQRRLGVILDALKTTPFRSGDLQETDARGRVCELIVEGEWLITFRTDHAVQEVRVMRIETIEDEPSA